MTLWKPDLSLPKASMDYIYPLENHSYSTIVLVNKLVLCAWLFRGALEACSISCVQSMTSLLRNAAKDTATQCVSAYSCRHIYSEIGHSTGGFHLITLKQLVVSLDIKIEYNKISATNQL